MVGLLSLPLLLEDCGILALRQYGIKDRLQGWGSLLAEH